MDRPRGMLQARRAVRSLVAANVLLGTLVAGATIAIMALLASVVSRVLLQHASLTQVWPSLWWLLAAVACRAALVAVQELVAHQTARRFTRSLRQELFAHLLLLGPAYTTAETTGELAATATEGIERLEPYVARYLPHRVLCVTVPALLLIAVFTQDWVSGAILLATAPILPLLMVLIGTYAKGHIDRQWSALSRMHAYFLDALQGLPTLKQYGRSGAERRRMAAVSRAFQSLTMRVLGYAFLSALVLEFITAGAIALVAVELGTRLLDGGISFERAFFILLLTPDYFRPLRELGAHRHAAMEGTPVLERIAQILSTPMRGRAGQPPLAPHITLPARALTVSLHDLTFTYPGSSPPALEGVSLQLLPGTRTAVVGRSGAGKSTLVNLLLRFIEPDSGEITADGVPLVSLSAARWREYLALVPQRPYLFAGTVSENIALGRQGASRREVERAASLAGAAEFIEHLPDLQP
jgi:ATP-binding cassette subfamily C protein CydD